MKGIDQEWRRNKQVACAHYLKVNPQTIVRVQESFEKDGKEWLDVTIRIQIQKSGGFSRFVAENFVPFRMGQKVRPCSTPLHPRDEKSFKDALIDKRRRTVAKMEFDEVNFIWWIWVKGKDHPFNAKLLKSAE